MVEAGGGPRERYGESVPPDILLPLERLGLASTFRRAGHLPCPGSVSIWGRPQAGYNDFILNPLGPAWHLARARFETMLAEQAVAAGATLCRRTRFTAARRISGGHEVLLDRGGRETHRPRVRWAIDASGWHARFARRCGARLAILDRMVTVVRFADLKSGTFTSQTLLEATPGGWWYCARLPGDRLVTALVTESENARALSDGGHRLWHDRLRSTRLVGQKLDGCELGGCRFHLMPVVSALLDPVEGDRWLAIGDAAASYDPIASQGIHKALADADDAARRVLAAFGHGPDPSRRYADRVGERWRDYLKNREYLYGLEQRWPDDPFWRRRQNAGPRWRRMASAGSR